MRVTLWKIFLSGGIFMWPILFFSVLSIALILERGITLFIFKYRVDSFLSFLSSSGENGKSGIDEIDREIFSLSVNEAESLISESFQLLVDKITRVIELISGIGGIAPLLGFMGTVYGMIVAFTSIAGADRVSVKLVASGISQALITTGFGLSVAVVCLFFDHLYRFVLSSHVHRLEKGVNKFFVAARREK